MFSLRTGVSALAVATAVLGLAAPGARAAAGTAAIQDFNGDGYADLVVSAPGGTIGGVANAGYVVVAYGSAHGLALTDRTVISRATAGVPGDPAADERFGQVTSAGDLDGDGYADLVVDAHGTAGSVIVWGGPDGLSAATALPGFTNYSATGDFNGDGRTDLALIDSPGNGLGDDPHGSRQVVWDGPISPATGQPAAVSLIGTAEDHPYDVMGVAAGDADGDGRTDLAFIQYVGDGGFASQVYYGSAGGGLADPTWAAGGGPRPAGLAFGDFDGDGRADLVIGDASDDEVDVDRGSANGISAGDVPDSVLTQDTPGVPGSSEAGDIFGAALATGDVNGDGYADLAVGNPAETLGEVEGGYVTVLFGGPDGATGAGAQAFSQDTAGVPGTVERGDRFGAAVALLDVNGNGYADLAAAATGEDGGNGAVWSLRGQAAGVTTDAALVLGPLGMGTPAAKAAFGTALR